MHATCSTGNSGKVDADAAAIDARVAIQVAAAVYGAQTAHAFGAAADHSPPNAAPYISATDLIINDAKSHLGQGYRYGAESPGQFDYSGLLYAVFQHTG